MKKSGIIATFVISLLTVPLYIYSFNNNLFIFWIIFILDRILSPLLASKFENALDTLDVEADTDDEFKSISKFMLSIVLLCILAICAMIYILFAYPKLFIVLMLGEALDSIAKKYFTKKNNCL